MNTVKEVINAEVMSMVLGSPANRRFDVAIERLIDAAQKENGLMRRMNEAIDELGAVTTADVRVRRHAPDNINIDNAGDNQVLRLTVAADENMTVPIITLCLQPSPS